MTTPRENLLRLLRRQGYDHVPVSFDLCPSLEAEYRRAEASGVPYAAHFGFPLANAPAPIPTDMDRAHFAPYHGAPDASVTIDQWGVGHRKTETSMHMTQMLHPLAGADSLEQIDAYPLPAFRAGNNRHIKAAVTDIKKRGLAAVGNMQCTVWETAWYLRGMENLMMDMLSDDPLAERLLARVEKEALARAALFAEAGVDILYLGDDIGMQQTTLMSMPLYRQWIQPRLARVIEAAKRVNPRIVILYHSCGYVEPLIPLLIEAGVDSLNPIQPECMDFEKIHAEYGDVLSFHGTIGTQTTMPFGTPAEVRQAVYKNLKIAGPSGGLFPSPTHLLEPEVPWENVRAYVDACKEYAG